MGQMLLPCRLSLGKLHCLIVSQRSAAVAEQAMCRCTSTDVMSPPNNIRTTKSAPYPFYAGTDNWRVVERRSKTALSIVAVAKAHC